jgi:hypothetical protein
VSQDIRLSMSLMANITGGRFINYTNNAADGLREAARDVQASYSAGYYASGDPDGKWHSLTVRTTRPDVELRHRKGYIAERQPSLAPASSDRDWRALITSAETSPGIAIMAHATFDTATRMFTLSAQFAVAHMSFAERDGAMEADLEVCTADVSSAGRVKFHTEESRLRLTPDQWESVRIGGVPYGRAWQPIADIAKVRVIVRDRRSGQIGAVDIPVSALRGVNPDVRWDKGYPLPNRAERPIHYRYRCPVPIYVKA